MIKVNSESEFFTSEQIKKIEDCYGAKFVYETELKTADGWSGHVGSVFYQPEPQPGHSSWFAIFKDHMNRHYITKADATVAVPVTALKVAENEYIYSHHRHHFLGRDGMAIDGGRDYTRIVGNFVDRTPELVYLKATPDGLQITEQTI